MNGVLVLEPPLRAVIEALGQTLVARGWMCGMAESCTGGLAGACCTAVPGASQWFAGGVVSYANAVKIRVLSVDPQELEAQGAVSEAVVRQMAQGLCRVLNVEAGVSISGVAGPGGGSPEKPVGTVWLGFCVQGRVDALRLSLDGDREHIRRAAVLAALKGLLQRLH